MFKKQMSPQVALLGLYFLILGMTALFWAFESKKDNPSRFQSHLLVVDTVSQSCKNLIDNFTHSENNAIPSIQGLFFKNISVMEKEMFEYKDIVIETFSRRAKIIFLLTAFSAVYYIFASGGVFRQKSNAHARLKIAVYLWGLTLIVTILNSYIAQNSLKMLLDRLDILAYYIPPEARTALLPPGMDSHFHPLFFLVLTGNMLIYIILPLWYINHPKIRKYLK